MHILLEHYVLLHLWKDLEAVGPVVDLDGVLKHHVHLGGSTTVDDVMQRKLM